MKGALVLGVAVPVVLAVIFALTPTEKVWLLTGWLIWIIVIFVVARGHREPARSASSGS